MQECTLDFHAIPVRSVFDPWPRSNFDFPCPAKEPEHQVLASSLGQRRNAGSNRSSSPKEDIPALGQAGDDFGRLLRETPIEDGVVLGDGDRQGRQSPPVPIVPCGTTCLRERPATNRGATRRSGRRRAGPRFAASGLPATNAGGVSPQEFLVAVLPPLEVDIEDLHWFSIRLG